MNEWLFGIGYIFAGPIGVLALYGIYRLFVRKKRERVRELEARK